MKSLYSILLLETVLGSPDGWENTLKDAGKLNNLMMGAALNLSNPDTQYK